MDKSISAFEKMKLGFRVWTNHLLVLLCLLLPGGVAAESAQQFSRPVVIAHRGPSSYAPEHTLEAVKMAHAMGADDIEPDVVQAKDDVPVGLHDIQLDATTDVAAKFPGRKRSDGRYYALDFTLVEIKQLRAGEPQDSYRFIVHLDWGRELFPPKKSFRSEPADFQRGEVEVDGKNLYFNEWDAKTEVERTSLPTLP